MDGGKLMNVAADQFGVVDGWMSGGVENSHSAPQLKSWVSFFMAALKQRSRNGTGSREEPVANHTATTIELTNVSLSEGWTKWRGGKNPCSNYTLNKCEII